ncbi:acetyltransferase [Micromonospora krabiensis]|uniref:Sugar O-acyltransferase, sialic acid O-acetyltransferase NeuD family n=1 Tax=Micromonospora krabiensis TaxID=307121 RepID=A0A1C3N1V5_9ACTN|nr:acetyltransferase [Micromonospora krabiensis]SBV26531.1 sugar O-acyltransferase, sialic acid O-acetyltransferase NeuD family [Micromonospora krabiensis]
MRDLVIVGAGGFARETAAAVHAVNHVRPTWRLRGFLDDDAALHGTTRAGLPILGGTDHLADLPETAVVVCVGSPRDYRARRRVVRRLDLPAPRYATVVHPSAQVGAGSVLGPGTVLLAGVVLTADVTVGAHVAVMPHAVLTHDDRVDDHATIASGVRLGGGAVLRLGAYVGAGALVREGVTVGAWSLVGMGSVVLRDVPQGEVWAGNPARRLRAADPGPTGPGAERSWARSTSEAPVGVGEVSTPPVALGELAEQRVVGS